jgi:hypothetical protein
MYVTNPYLVYTQIFKYCTTSIQAAIVIRVFFLFFCLRSRSYRMYSNAKHPSEIHFFDAPTMTENKQLYS